ncbi:hypothetical protein [Streptomyces olivochromogenes]|uniref:Glycine cleavage system H protein n=1 Tax=Streptomyces olivochromogenes TaxID=1963 RepID=A0A250VTD6_STROL|nr:hypothetical protein [Streptomyces olivochromogenes]KUN38347.1 hypothetical protein AQJ27_44285 [Streptomyces olivochromogenes]GAX57473.1 glycine cleavage system H protein [Streptomyces olivochromogenes]
MPETPADLRYSSDRRWFRLDHAGGLVRVGVTGFANTDPYGQGWMFETDIDPSAWDEQVAVRMDARAHRSPAGA